MSTDSSAAFQLHPSFYLVAALVSSYTLSVLISSLRGPLAKLPGPQVSKWTNLRLKWAVLTGQRMSYIDDLHRKYGPVVRVSPSEVAISDLAATKKIHKVGSGFLKSPWYQEFAPSNGLTNLFTCIDPHAHAQRRRLLGQPLSESALYQSFEPYVASRVDLAVQKIGEEIASTRKYANCHKWWRFMAADVISGLSFGQSFGTLEGGQLTQYILDSENAGFFGALRVEIPILDLLSYLPIRFVKAAAESNVRMQKFALDQVRSHRARLAEDPNETNHTLLSKIYSAQEKGALSEDELACEARTYIIAGSDTTAVTMTYLTWVLCKRYDIQARMIEEVSGLPDDFKEEDLKRLPFLDNVIKETLRLYGAAPGGLPRMPPKGGFEVNGMVVPESATVSTQAYTLHRDPQIFPEPGKFDPSRWESPTQEMKDAFLPFGGLSRNCIGQHLAMMELRRASAKLWRKFPKGLEMAYGETGDEKTGQSDAGMSDEDMDFAQFFLIMPKGQRCFVRPVA